MAEASLHVDSERLSSDNKSTDDGKSTSSGKKHQSSYKSKKDEMADFSERLAKQEQRFSSIDSKMDKLFALFLDNKANQDDSDCQNEAFGAARRQQVVIPRETLFGKSSSEENRGNIDSGQQDDVLSIFVDSAEKEDCGFLSTPSVSSEILQNEEKERFVKYLAQANKDDNNNNLSERQKTETQLPSSALKEKFGTDAVTNKSKSTFGISLEKHQVDILNDSWRSSNPEKVSSYRDSYRNVFPVHDDYEEHFKVPGIDDTVEALLINKYGRSASFGRTPSLHSKNMKSFEKLSFYGQLASRMGLISTCYTQQALGVLLDTLQSDELNLDRAIQMVRDIFAMSTKTLDQVGRAGAFHHLVRRNATLIDTGLSDYKEYSHAVMSLPLTSEGVFGAQFDKKLKEKSELSKHLAEILPETFKKPQTVFKRKMSSATATVAKKPRSDEYRGRPGTSQNFSTYKQQSRYKAPIASKPVSSFRKTNTDKRF